MKKLLKILFIITLVFLVSQIFNTNLDRMAVISLVLPIIFTIISLLLCDNYEKDRNVIDSIEFYTPEGFNSAEIGFVHIGRSVNKDVVSLMIYLANKGYLKIVQNKEKSFKLIKLKEYSGNNSIEKMFLKVLFRFKNEVEVYDLIHSYYMMNKITKELNKKENK